MAPFGLTAPVLSQGAGIVERAVLRTALVYIYEVSESVTNSLYILMRFVKNR